MLLTPLTLKPRKITKSYHNKRGRSVNKYSLSELINGAKQIITFEDHNNRYYHSLRRVKRNKQVLSLNVSPMLKTKYSLQTDTKFQN